MTRYSRSRACLGMAVALLAAGCERSPVRPRAIPVAVSDSAGVPVYTLAELPSWNDSAFAVGLTLERAISTGGASPTDEPLLFQPQAYARMDDGRLVVLDAGEQRLVVLDANEDRAEARFGPTGQGPGEIWSSNCVLWPGMGESVWVLDPGNQRLSQFSLAGTLEEERAVEIGGMGGMAFQRPGTYEPMFWKMFLGGESQQELQDSIGRFDAQAGEVVFFASMPPRVEERRRNVDQPRLFAPMGWFSPVGDGVVVGRTDVGRFRHYSDDGQVLGIIQVPMFPAPIDQSEEADILEEFYGVARGSTVGRRGVADEYPLFNIMWPLNDTLFAVQQSYRATPRGEPRIPQQHMVWRVFSVHGRYAGAIQFPDGVAQPYWIEGDRIIATHRDSLGIATIESYRLQFVDRGP